MVFAGFGLLASRLAVSLSFSVYFSRQGDVTDTIDRGDKSNRVGKDVIVEDLLHYILETSRLDEGYIFHAICRTSHCRLLPMECR